MVCLEHPATMAVIDMFNDTSAVQLCFKLPGIFLCSWHCLRVSKQRLVIAIVAFLMKTPGVRLCAERILKFRSSKCCCCGTQNHLNLCLCGCNTSMVVCTFCEALDPRDLIVGVPKGFWPVFEACID